MNEPTPEQFSQWLAEAMRSVPGASQALLLPRGLTGLIAGEVARLAFAAGAAAAADHVPVVKDSLTAAPAAEGEVAELVAQLRSTAQGLESQAYSQTAALLTRGADLLEQGRPASVPVSGWQPIGTAPKNGTEILVSDYDAIEIVSWENPPGEAPGWYTREGEAVFPAWWQPLADHPSLPLPTPEPQP